MPGKKKRSSGGPEKREPAVVELEDSEEVEIDHGDEGVGEEVRVPFEGRKGEDAVRLAQKRLDSEGWTYDETREDFEGEGGHWKSPISVDAIDMVGAVRRSLEALGVRYTRKSRSQMYSQMYIIAPLPRTAYVYRFVLRKSDVIIDIYDQKFTHAGSIGFIEVDNLTFDNKETVRKVLLGAVETLTREPWHFPLALKAKHGLLLPEYRRAKKAWSEMGFDSFGKGSRSKKAKK